MDLLDSARDVLALSSASTSKSSSTIASTSTRTGDLVRRWCEALKDDSLALDDKEVVVRALRATKSSEDHARILDSTAPFLLDPLPSLRLQAALCVLQHVSTSPTTLVHAHLSALVSAISRALGPLPYQLPSASSTLHRFASTCLRILNAVVLKIHPLPPDTSAALPALLATWIYHGAGPVGAVTPAVDRGRTPASTPLSFGVMSAFAQSAPAVSTRRRQGSTASATSSRASSARRNGPGSDSEEDGSRKYDRRRDSAQIRHDALTCLRSLALACAALDALLEDSAPYLALAEDRSTSSSFTSLSAKLGETVSELHLALSSLLRNPTTSTTDREDLHLALLGLAAKVARNSPYGRIKRALARQLATAVLPDLASSSHALTAIAERYTATSSTQTFDWQELGAATAPLLDEAGPEEVQVAGWTLLAALVPVNGPHNWSAELARLLNPPLASPSLALALAHTAFLVALADTSHDPRTLPPSFPAILSAALDSPYAPVRARACSALPGRALAPPTSSLDAWRLALTLVERDPSPLVRDAACRALGLLAKAEPAARGRRSAGEVREAVRVLVAALGDVEVGSEEGGHERAAGLEAGGALWTLANCCDLLVDGDISDDELAQILSTALGSLASDESDEQVRTSAFRIVAAIGRRIRARDELVEDRVFEAVQVGLDHPAAKVRWNAALAAASLLASSPSSSSPRARILLSTLLAAILADSSYKVRIQACGALLSAQRAGTALPAGEADRVAEAGRQVRLALEERRVSQREKGHAERLLALLDDLSSRL
ncbi:uncharacterized protein RHOBADRAFT_43746 [Rhodotorula graminis WP1]|uniref:DUF4042 domain-containing protein n=1 Tax=Rhodotorula graminis (strain WP1) TaxID=578459 RepID=A0A194S3E5_RHOGW|nr:uncharacterized protein RHOBADRAFT_43746 [Rhodotorula graminis WP1]KPV75258.1 hypothetical protein RHOBADRAFT_43746 [Rhodotorula graminis WP1]